MMSRALGFESAILQHSCSESESFVTIYVKVEVAKISSFLNPHQYVWIHLQSREQEMVILSSYVD